MKPKAMEHTSKVTFKIVLMDSCSQAARSSFVTVVFFFARPRAGRGEGVVGAGEATEIEGLGIGLGFGVAGGGVAAGGEEPDAEDDGVVLASCCSFASLFKRI